MERDECVLAFLEGFDEVAVALGFGLRQDLARVVAGELDGQENVGGHIARKLSTTESKQGRQLNVIYGLLCSGPKVVYKSDKLEAHRARHG